jgi:uncharacterized NAD-dependent epimerase/dehydratase family protein
MKRLAIVHTNGLLASDFAKTCHGLLRGSERFEVLAVIDAEHAGKDAGLVMDGIALGIPVLASVDAFFAATERQPEVFVVGVAFPGGRLPESARNDVARALGQGLHLVSGLHQLLADDEEFQALATSHGAEIHDIRRPRPASELSFWSGKIRSIKTPRIAVLGVDCAVGKRTTCKLLMEACRADGLRTEMIYTGQTGWMQGHPYGFIFDSTPNDFVSGELEKALLSCVAERAPELILIEGQSGLRNPSGPCGSELLLSANAHGAILQICPGREFFIDFEHLECPIPQAAEEVALIQAYGVPVLAVSINASGLEEAAARDLRQELEDSLGIPVLLPLEDGVDRLVPKLRQLL